MHRRQSSSLSFNEGTNSAPVPCQSLVNSLCVEKEDVRREVIRGSCCLRRAFQDAREGSPLLRSARNVQATRDQGICWNRALSPKRGGSPRIFSSDVSRASTAGIRLIRKSPHFPARWRRFKGTELQIRCRLVGSKTRWFWRMRATKRNNESGTREAHGGKRARNSFYIKGKTRCPGWESNSR